ncbi:MAG: TIM barrel protein [Spirochaetales bacterium]
MSLPPLIGVNLYCFRDHCQTLEGLGATLARLAAIGYPSVQVSGLPASITPAQVRAALDRHGLVACAAHDNLEALTQRPHEVVAKLRTLGCRFTALGYPGHENLAHDHVEVLRDQLVTAARVLASEGLQLGYHNHAEEFQAFRGTSIYAWLFDTTPADLLWAEPDVAWLQAGGGSPVAWIRRLAGRIPAIHLKDYTWEGGQPRFCELGHGNLDLPGIVAALHETQVPIWIVEQDDPVPERDIFASAALSLEFLHQRSSQ